MTAAVEEKWYNLSEMSRLTGINRAQLHKYVKSHPDRIRSQRFGARTKFHETAVQAFEQIREEGLKRVGKPVTRRDKVDPANVKRKPGRPAVAKAAPASTQYYSLAEMARMTGINRVQLHKISRAYASRIPSRKVGGRTQYPTDAADVFKQLRDEQRVSGPKAVVAPVRTAPTKKTSSAPRAKAARPAPAFAPVDEPEQATLSAAIAPAAAEGEPVAGAEQAIDALTLAIRIIAAPADVQAAIRVLLDRVGTR